MHRRLGSRARSAVFAPIGDLGRAAGVEKRLAEAIRSGILVDGERLPSEAELSAMLGVATVTAREALVGLRASGLITTLRGRGGGSFVVRPAQPAEEDLRRWLGAMSRVELADRGVHYAVVLIGSTELAAERATAADVEDLRGLLASVDTDDVPAARQADTELHLALAALTRSARLSRELMRLEADFGVLLRLPMSDDAHRLQVVTDAQGVVTAVERREPDVARTVMRSRVRRALGDLAEMQAVLR